MKLLRIGVIIFCTTGAYLAIPIFSETVRNTAFHLGNVAISWLFLTCLAVFLGAIRATK